MYKKSSSGPRDSKKSNSSFHKKDDSRGSSSFGKKSYKSEGGSKGGDGKDRPRKPYGESGGSGFKKDGPGFKKERPYSKSGFKPGDRSANPATGYKKSDAEAFDRKPFNRDRPQRDDRDSPGRKPFADRGERSDSDRGPRKEFKKPFSRDDRSGGAEKRPYSGRTENTGDRGAGRGERPAGNYRKTDSGPSDRKPYDREKPRGGSSSSSAGRRPFEDRREGGGESRPRQRDDRSGDQPKRPYAGRPENTRSRDDDRSAPGGKRPYSERSERPGKGADRNDRPAKKSFAPREENFKKKDEEHRETPADFYKKNTRSYTEAEQRYLEDDNEEWEEVDDKRKKRVETAKYPMPLNKYIAHSGECSRRDAAELVKQGKAKVNGELITDPGHKVNEEDKVTLSGKKLVPQKGLVYILLNKPKGFITTNDDPQGRRTVMDLVKSADVGRLYPVGRLDRATTGLILITNDGDLAQRMAHPIHKTKKVYHVTLDKALTEADFEKIMVGIELEDGKAIVDEMAYLEKKTELGLEIHSGKNRIVRRIFESLGYDVEKLDRVMYAGLTKKNLPRSKWRFLDEREIVLLKHFKS